jgi:hypothetical protein
MLGTNIAAIEVENAGMRVQTSYAFAILLDYQGLKSGKHEKDYNPIRSFRGAKIGNKLSLRHYDM